MLRVYAIFDAIVHFKAAYFDVRFLLIVSVCIAQPCQNGGVLDVDTCTCVCAEGYSGVICGSECTAWSTMTDACLCHLFSNYKYLPLNDSIIDEA